MRILLIILLLAAFTTTHAQESSELPYESIGEYPENYSSGNVIKRFIDGLAYRYHWASKDLKEVDLTYKPSQDARTTKETLDHICGLSQIIIDAAKGDASAVPIDFSELNYSELRARTLNNLKEASALLANLSESEVIALKVKFKSSDSVSEFEFWHMLNGPISDAIYHVGQVVTLRRASGNPISPKVSVFMGKNRS